MACKLWAWKVRFLSSDSGPQVGEKLSWDDWEHGPCKHELVPTLGVADEEECIKWGECDSNNPTLALNKVY